MRVHQRRLVMEKMNEQIGKMEKQLKDWKVKMDDYVAKAAKDTKNDNHKQADNLKAKYHFAQSKLEEAKKGGNEKWEGFKKGVELAWKDAEKAFGEIKH